MSTFDIDKICRTCLALNGPLLSIYEGSSSAGGSGSIGDMLKDFTKAKLLRSEHLPDKVCLACISEINRCYSFKIKCENSIRTLCQLIPEAVFVVEEDNEGIQEKVAQIDVGVQTSPEKLKLSTCVEVQTQERAFRHQQVQTECQQETASVHHVSRDERDLHNLKVEGQIRTTDGLKRPFTYIKLQPQAKRKCDKAIEQHNNEVIFKKSAKSENKRTRLTENVKAIATTPAEINETDAVYEISEEEFLFNDVTVESAGEQNKSKVIEEHNNEVISKKSAKSENKVTRSTENTKPIATTSAEINELDALYEISDEEFQYNDVTIDNEDEQKKSTVDTANDCFDRIAEGEEEDYEQLILTAKMDELNAEQSNFNFTIYNNENGETEFIAKRSKCPPTTKSVQQKPELKCSECIMTFISENNLRRHVMKRHACSNIKQTTEENEAEPIVIAETQNDADDTLPSALQAVLLQELQDEVEIAKQSTDSWNASNSPVAETLKAKLCYFCDRCNAGFALRKSLNYHRKHGACTTISYKCDECDRVFISEEGLLEHKEIHERGHICNECNKELKSKELLSQHLIEEHKRSIRNQCTICKKVFTMLSALKDHMRTHSGEKPFLCPVCNKAFSQSANLKQHVMRHSKVKSFHCDECDNSYVTKAELFSHKRTHTGDQPFKCEICNAQFTTSSSLVKHKRKHTGERPYACDICPMRFAALNVLKNHRRTHTGEKPFKCPYCSKGFTQKGDCQIHQRTHTGERKYVCACGEKFTHLGTLRTHVKTHEKRNNQTNTRSKKDFDIHKAVLHYSILNEEVEQINNPDDVDGSKDVVEDVQDLTTDEELMHLSIEAAE